MCRDTTHLQTAKNSLGFAWPSRVTGEDNQTDSDIVRSILEGKKQVVSHSGTSQYSQGGSSSACGLAALNCARCLLAKASASETLQPHAFMQDLIGRQIMEEVCSICALWSSDLHLEVDDIHRIPFFNHSLELVHTEFNIPRTENFRNLLLRELGSRKTSAAIIITRPPEILTCIKFLISRVPIFLIFDSHPRPSHPDGAAFIFSRSLDVIAAHLDDLLVVDERFLKDRDMQWQTQLLNIYSGHVFVSKPISEDPVDLMHAVLEASLGMLEKRAEVSDLQGRNSALAAENDQLQLTSLRAEENRSEMVAELDELRKEVRDLRSAVEQHNCAVPHNASHIDNVAGPSGSNSNSGSESGSLTPTGRSPVNKNMDSVCQSSTSDDHAVVSEDMIPSHWDDQMSLAGKQHGLTGNDKDILVEQQRRAVVVQKTHPATRDNFRSRNAVAGPSNSKKSCSRSEPRSSETTQHALGDEPYITIGPSHLSSHKSAVSSLSKSPDNAASSTDMRPSLRHDFERAAEMQREYDEEDQRLRAERRQLDDIPRRTSKPYLRRIRSIFIRRRNNAASVATVQPLGENDSQRAAEMWYEEDHRLRVEQKPLASVRSRTFYCGVCLDICPEDDIARVEPCAHAFCRDCIRNHMHSKLKERRFPIYCPTCMTGTSTKEPVAISDALAQEVGITEEAYMVWSELALTPFSIKLHCRKCQQTVFVDRQEYETMQIITCPLPNCAHRWCTSCLQAVPISDLRHSCDGTSELKDLVEREGWKYCPGPCKTPIQKTAGCNHMTCTSPGCNTHFCYICGEAIVRSGLHLTVDAAIKAHFKKCQLFEDVAD